MGTIASVSVGEVGDSEKITVADSSIGFTTSKILVDSEVGPVKASKAEFKVETAPIRFTRDGTAPTTTTGIPGAIGDVITVEGIENVKRFRAIRETSTSGVINPEYTR